MLYVIEALAIQFVTLGAGILIGMSIQRKDRK